MLLRKKASCADLITALKAEVLDIATLESALADLIVQRSEVPERQLWKALDLAEKQASRHRDAKLGELLDAIQQNANWEIQCRHRAS